MKTLLAGTIVSLLIATPAFAGNQTQYQVSGTLAQSCSVTAPATQTFNPASTTVQAIGSLTYQCNFSGNATMLLWTQNGGAVVSPAAVANGNVAQTRPYSFVFDGTTLGQLTNASGTATPVVRAVTAANTNQTGATTMQIASAATVAGTYTDTIFVSIAP